MVFTLKARYDLNRVKSAINPNQPYLGISKNRDTSPWNFVWSCADFERFC